MARGGRILLLWMLTGTVISGPATTPYRMNPWNTDLFGDFDQNIKGMIDPFKNRLHGISVNLDQHWQSLPDLSKHWNSLPNLGNQLDSLPDLDQQWNVVTNGLTDQWTRVSDTMKEVSTDLDAQLDRVSKNMNEQWERNNDDFQRNMNSVSDSIQQGVAGCCQFDFINHFSTPFYGMDVSSIFRRQKPWWAGENVCQDKLVEDGQLPNNIRVNSNSDSNLHMQVQKCQESWDSRECTDTVYVNGKATTVKVTYSCCPGFKLKSEDGRQPSCQEHDLKPMEETLAALDGTDFLALISEENLLEDIRNSTVFMPTNEALDNFKAELNQYEGSSIIPNERENMIYSIDDGLLSRKRRYITVSEVADMREILLAHLTPQIIHAKDLVDGAIIPTKGDHSVIRISEYHSYPTKIIMANCAKISSKEHHTTEGMVHVLDSVIMPATATVGNLLESDPQFRRFRDILGKDLLNDLKSQDSVFTVFVPTEEALENLSIELKGALLAEGKCGPQIVKSHIIPEMLCSGAIEAVAVTESLSGDKLRFMRDEDGNIYVQGVKIVMRDLMANNGVIHVIDKVIIPESARSLQEALKQTKASTFLDLLSPELLTKLSARVRDGLTLFLPSEDSLSKLPSSVLEQLKNNQEELETMLLHHMVPANNKLPALEQDRLMSLAGTPLHKATELTSNYLGGIRNRVTVGCARVWAEPELMCGGYIHTIDRLLTPPKGDILDVIKKSGDHGEFLKLMEFVGLSEFSEDAHTIFAPVDSAFKSISDSLRDLLFSNRTVAESVVRNHIVPEIVCCSPASYTNMGYRSLQLPSGETLVMKTHWGSFSPINKVNHATIERCNRAAENGVVHHVDSILLPRHIQLSQDRNPFRRMWSL